MAWDKTVPSDNTIISQFPSIVRSDKTHLENCLEKEHKFVDDSASDFGRHKEITLPNTVAFWLNIPTGASYIEFNLPIVSPNTKPVLAIVPTWNTTIYIDEPTQGVNSWVVRCNFGTAPSSAQKLSVVAFYSRL